MHLMTKRAAIWSAAVIGAALFLAALIVASGLRFYTVMTPSMGQTAPVGTLVVTRPADTYQVGEIITYQAYNVDSPLDGEAATWAEHYGEWFPTDARDLRPPNLA